VITRRSDRASPPLLFGLAPRGVYRASSITAGAVGSYPTFSPLPYALDQSRPALGLTSGLPQRCKLTGGLLLCGTFRSRTPKWLPPTSSMPPPGVTRRVVQRSPDFPPAHPSSSLAAKLEVNRRSPDSPAVPDYTPKRSFDHRDSVSEFRGCLLIASPQKLSEILAS
jgi:hypothetical protein